jgi:hypothetical protein
MDAGSRNVRSDIRWADPEISNTNDKSMPEYSLGETRLCAFDLGYQKERSIYVQCRFERSPLPDRGEPQTASESQQYKRGEYLEPDRRAFRGWTIVVVAIGIIVDCIGGWFGTALIARRRYWVGCSLFVVCLSVSFACLMWAW